MDWSGDPPAQPGQFADFYEEQIDAAQSRDDQLPATPAEVARLYEKHLEVAREIAFREARTYFLRRAYEKDLGTQVELGSTFELTQGTVSKLVQKEAGRSDPRKMPLFPVSD